MNKKDRLAKAQKLIREDNYLKAFEEFCQLHYDYPKDAEIIQTCMALFVSITEGNYDFEPETAEQYIFRGVAKFYKDELKESIADFDKALSLNPDLDYAIKCKAFSLTFLGDYTKSIALLTEAIKLKETGEYYDDIADNYSKLKDLKKAVEYHEKAVACSPDDARLWFNYATQLGLCGDYSKAIEMFDKAIRLYPQYGDALYNREYYLKKLQGL